MKIILTEDMPSLGGIGDIVEVADGYGRNYLIPSGKALIANKANLKKWEEKRKIVEVQKIKDREKAEALAESIASITCEFYMKAGEEGKLYGSVTSMDIANYLEEKGIKIDRKRIQLDEPIKSLGEFDVPIKLHSEVTAQIKVVVLPETKQT